MFIDIKQTDVQLNEYWPGVEMKTINWYIDIYVCKSSVFSSRVRITVDYHVLNVGN